MILDTTFDYRADSSGRDPDKFSRTLRRHHRTLWSKTLPSGQLFNLDDTQPGIYLHHQSEAGEFFLTSDSVIPTFKSWKSMKHIVDLFSDDENEEFEHISYTIGGMMIFPGNKIDGKQTINGARGLNRKISDRFDLTLECIRRHYLGEASPLAETLHRYKNFFDLFQSFAGYVEFFLLHDLVNPRDCRVKFLAPFDDFNRSPAPTNKSEYIEYRENTVAFVTARNSRIHRHANHQN